MYQLFKSGDRSMCVVGKIIFELYNQILEDVSFKFIEFYMIALLHILGILCKLI